MDSYLYRKHTTMTTPIIAICNHKGGSGKTTTAWHLAQALNADDTGTLRRVLLVDLDDQATLTNRLAHQAARIGSPIETQPTIADALDGAPTTVYHYTPILDYIPADHRLAWVAAKMQASSPNHAFLARVLRHVEPYDYVLLDSPPSAGIIMINALAACTHTLIPVTASEESWDGRQRMERMIAEIASVLGKEIRNLGAVLTMRSPRSKAQDYYEALNAQADLLGAIPHAVGMDADKRIYQAYEPIASAVLAKLAQEVPC